MIPKEEILFENLGKIAYTLDKTYLSRLEDDYGVLSFDQNYNSEHQTTYIANIRALRIKRCIIDKEERVIDCFKNVIGLFSDSDDTLALVFKRSPLAAEMYFVVKNIGVGKNGVSRKNIDLLAASIRGNFPGTEVEIISPDRISDESGDDDTDTAHALGIKNAKAISVLSGIPSEKSEKFICQGIEKLLNGIVPKTDDESYTVVLMAESIPLVEIRSILNGFEELETSLAPFAGYQFQTGKNENETTGEMESLSHSEGVSHSISKTHSINIGANGSRFSSQSNSTAVALSASTQKGAAIATAPIISSLLTIGGGLIAGAPGAAVGATIGSLGPTLSKAKSTAAAITDAVGESAGFNIGGIFGYGYSWGKTETTNTEDTQTKGTNHSISLGTSENTTYTYKSYLVTNLLEKLESTTKRIDQSKSNGLWRYAAYVLSSNSTVTINVANFLRSISQGDESYIEPSFIQTWVHEESNEQTVFGEILKYVAHFSHPVFGNLNDGTPVTPTVNVSTTELSNIFAFPRHSLPNLPVYECVRFGREPQSLETTKLNFDIGCIYHMHTTEENRRLSINMKKLTSHTFIAGSTGAGKSNTIYKILDEALKNKVNFLVIEPAKGEYKHVFGNLKNVNVYGTNHKMMPLLRLNPFSFPKNIHVLEHLDRLVEIFNVCWPMYAAMPAVLKNAVEKSYEDCGWELTESTNEFGDDLYPNFADVARNVKKVIDSSEYDTENKGAYKGSLLTRLNSLTNGINGLIFSDDEIPLKELFDSNVIVDLSLVGSSETKSLLMGMLVLKLQEYRMSCGGMNKDLEHLTVLEEAHNLLKRTSTEQLSESGNLIGKSVEMIANAIAEMRTYGEGFIIADHAPELLDKSVIRNTNTKIIMQLPDYSDRELIGKSAHLNDNQIDEIPRFPEGVAAVYQNNWIEPVLCKIDKFDHDEKEKYRYTMPQYEQKAYDSAKALELAELLCQGTALSREKVFNEINPIMLDLKLASSVRVAIINMLLYPPQNPRMTKFAPFMSVLFPDVYKAAEKAYSESCDPNEWTRVCNFALESSLKQAEIQDTVRSDIIQGVLTDHILNKNGKKDDLERWKQEVERA